MAGKDEATLLEFRIPARSDQLGKMRAAVRECVEASGCSENPTADIVLAVDEACQNVIRHAYKGDPEGVIELIIRREGDDLVFSLFDSAPEIDPSKVKPRDLDDIRPGGLGTHFIQKVMDRADFLPRPRGNGNLLRMVKRIE
jgi:sigma-B regulation protein RsbU (phosphoserine phosphatase)